LSSPLTDPSTGRVFHYRFPIVRARNLVAAWSRLVDGSLSLTRILQASPDERTARHALVEGIPGIGPKQASLFLRNVGFAVDLAVLDVHILRYMRLCGCEVVPPITLRSYTTIEDLFRSQVTHFGADLAHVDLAVWIVMREAKRLGVCPS
jgi:N-glycosylase/DNA lyase